MQASEMLQGGSLLQGSSQQSRFIHVGSGMRCVKGRHLKRRQRRLSKRLPIRLMQKKRQRQKQSCGDSSKSGIYIHWPGRNGSIAFPFSMEGRLETSIRRA